MPKSVPEQFRHVVEKHPHRVAIFSTTQQLTYAELDRRSDHVAVALLSRRGTGAEPVALLFGQELAAFEATIGVLKSGKFYVTLEPLEPLTRMAAILADTGAKILLTNTVSLSLARQLCGGDVEILNIDTVEDGLFAQPAVEIRPDAYAYIGYTSGSTGTPKGVIETHRNHLCHWRNLMRQQPDYDKERVLFLNRLSFSGGQLAFYLTFLAGATLCLYDLQEEGIAGLPAWIEKHQITVWNSVPTVFRAFTAQVQNPRQIASIRLLRLASDTILPQDIEAYRRLFPPHCKLWVCYALTEAKTVTIGFFDKDAPVLASTIPSGYPIDGMEVQIVDEQGAPLGPNQVGEIIVRSQFLAPGYWRDAPMTAQRFQSDPARPEIFTIWTGDLGLLQPDGNLIHRGRKG